MGFARVTVVSDSHISDRTPEAAANWDAVVDHVAATGHDLVVHAGDVATLAPPGLRNYTVGVDATDPY